MSTRWEGAAVHSCGPAGLHCVDLPLDEYCEQFGEASGSTKLVIMVCDDHPTPNGVGGLIS